MATVPKKIEYPTSDGKPMAETPHHRDLMMDLIRALQDHYAGDPTAYVSGNMMMFYEEGNRRRHLAPDVFVSLGVGDRDRLYYLVWEEGKGPDLVIELTSRTTRREDQGKKRGLYRDVLRVREYFLFDPFADYLKPPMQGYRLEGEEYVPIEPVDGRLPSLITGLHLERDGRDCRLYDPALGRWLPTPAEKIAAAEAELDRLRREVEALRRSKANGPNGASG
jgi:Uma2 family endonuclease